MFLRISGGDAFAKMVSGILENAARVIIGIRGLAQYGKMKLSKNLSLSEVTKSHTAIKYGISNKPSGEHLSNLMALAVNVFQPVRDYFGKPIAVTSGYRSKALNDLIGGASGSQHSKGQALDLDADVFGGLENYQLFNYIKDNLEFDQLIWEFGDEENPDWVHVSYKASGNRGEVLKAVRQKGKTIYKKW
jgi:zinc D-Ala-D-Ala carboxypeptidase